MCESIHRERDPGLRDDLFANRLNRVVCPECGFSFRVDKNLLYFDPRLRFLVYWAEKGDERIGEANREFKALQAAWKDEALPLPSLQMVFARIELVERVFLLEAGLDARLIEYVKYLVYLNNRARVDPERKRILFDAKDSTPERLCFVVQDAASGRLEQALGYERAAYRSLSELFDRDDRTPSLMELFPGPVICARRLLLESSAPAQEGEAPGPGPAGGG